MTYKVYHAHTVKIPGMRLDCQDKSERTLDFYLAIFLSLVYRSKVVPVADLHWQQRRKRRVSA
jgi:hypothetical protein